jgi:hypothetical protein
MVRLASHREFVDWQAVFGAPLNDPVLFLPFFTPFGFPPGFKQANSSALSSLMGLERSMWMERKRFIHVQKCSSPPVLSTVNKKINNYDFKWLHKR